MNETDVMANTIKNLMQTVKEQADRIAELKKEKWMAEHNTAQETLKKVIDLLVLHHDTLACSSYPMKRKEK